MSKARLYIIIRGRVQGVNFRFRTKQRAEELGLTGWIKNTSDGEVECLAEGEKNNLEQFLDWCRKGPSFAEVRNLDFEWLDSSEGFKKFEII